MSTRTPRRPAAKQPAAAKRPTTAKQPATVKQTEAIGGEIVMPGEETPYGTLAVIKDPLGALICLGHPPAGMS